MAMLTLMTLTFLLAFLVQAFFLLLTVFFRTDKLTDLSYGLSFIILLSFLVAASGQELTLANYVLIAAVFLWSLRLIVYLTWRITKTGVERRFDGWRKSWRRLLAFWGLQAFSAPMVLLPVTYLLTNSVAEQLSLWFYVGLGLWLIGFCLEVIADWQLAQFRFSKPQKKKPAWLEKGLWRYSRHPNYFGEIVLWWGLFLCGLAVYSSWAWLLLLSPLYLTLLIRFVSGVAPMTRSFEKRFGHLKKYQKYKRQTNMIILGPRRSK